MSLKKKEKLKKSLIKKEPPKKPTENSVKELSKSVKKEETDMNWELFQKYFKSTKSSALLKELYLLKS